MGDYQSREPCWVMLRYAMRISGSDDSAPDNSEREIMGTMGGVDCTPCSAGSKARGGEKEMMGVVCVGSAR
jgi:hypothetical protein